MPEKSGKTIYITEEQYRMLLQENRLSKNVSFARRYLMQNFNMTQEKADKELNEIKEIVPSVRVLDCKFLLGVTRMYKNFELRHPPVVSAIDRAINLIAAKYPNDYNYDLNGLTARAIILQYRDEIRSTMSSDKETMATQQYKNTGKKGNNGYRIVQIPDFKAASKYSKYCDWCITKEEYAYNNYTNGGTGIFYFLLKNGYSMVPKEVGENAPYDAYGLSMLAVCVYADGSLASCTTRWNHENGSSENSMNVKQISELIGRNFYEVFKPRDQRESNAEVETFLKNYQETRNVNVFAESRTFKDGRHALVCTKKKNDSMERRTRFPYYLLDTESGQLLKDYEGSYAMFYTPVILSNDKFSYTENANTRYVLVYSISIGKSIEIGNVTYLRPCNDNYMFVDRYEYSSIQLINLNDGKRSDPIPSLNVSSVNTEIGKEYGLCVVAGTDRENHGRREYVYDCSEMKPITSEPLSNIELFLKGYLYAESTEWNAANIYDMSKRKYVFKDWYDDITSLNMKWCRLFVDRDTVKIGNLQTGELAFKGQALNFRIKTTQDKDIVIGNTIAGRRFFNLETGESWDENQNRQNSIRQGFVSDESVDRSLSLIESILNENREGKNINLARRYVKSLGYSQDDANRTVDKVRSFIHNSRDYQCSYLVGATRLWMDNGFGDMTDQQLNSPDVAKKLDTLSTLIMYAEKSGGFDANLNGMSADQLYGKFKEQIESDKEAIRNEVNRGEYKTNNDYTIEPIDTFEEASKYSMYCSWCVTKDETHYEQYTKSGIYRFYFCLKNGFEKLPEEKGEGYPLDEYGNSMLAVLVRDDGSLESCTNRWNNEQHAYNEEGLSKLFGVNFYETFKPSDEESKRKANLSRSERFENVLNERISQGNERNIIYTDTKAKSHLMTRMHGDSEHYVFAYLDENSKKFKIIRNQDGSAKKFTVLQTIEGPKDETDRYECSTEDDGRFVMDGMFSMLLKLEPKQKIAPVNNDVYQISDSSHLQLLSSHSLKPVSENLNNKFVPKQSIYGNRFVILADNESGYIYDTEKETDVNGMLPIAPVISMPDSYKTELAANYSHGNYSITYNIWDRGNNDVILNEWMNDYITPVSCVNDWYIIRSNDGRMYNIFDAIDRRYVLEKWVDSIQNKDGYTIITDSELGTLYLDKSKKFSRDLRRKILLNDVDRINAALKGHHTESRISFALSREHRIAYKLNDDNYLIYANADQEDYLMIRLDSKSGDFRVVTDNEGLPIIYDAFENHSNNKVYVISDLGNGRKGVYDNDFNEVATINSNQMIETTPEMSNFGYLTSNGKRTLINLETFKSYELPFIKTTKFVGCDSVYSKNILCIVDETFSWGSEEGFYVYDAVKDEERDDLVPAAKGYEIGGLYQCTILSAKDEEQSQNLYDPNTETFVFDELFEDFTDVLPNGKWIIVRKDEDHVNIYDMSTGGLLFDDWVQRATLSNGRDFVDVMIGGKYYKLHFDGRMESRESVNRGNLVENFENEVAPSEISTEPLDKKSELCPKVWNGFDLNPKIRMRLLDIADQFWFDLGLDWVKVRDIIITGSICNYNWSRYSDIDLHIVVDYRDVDENTDLVKEFMYAQKNDWNDNHLNLSIYGFPVEIYVQDVSEEHVSSGIYSLERNQWIVKPSSEKIKEIDGDSPKIKEKAAYLMTLIDRMERYMQAYRDDSHRMELLYEKANSFIGKLRKMRRRSLDKGGEMSIGNLVYKIMRQKGYVDKLYKIKYTSFDYLNSL